MLVRMILPNWAQNSDKPKVIEGDYELEAIQDFNSSGYNIYYFPNYPSSYHQSDHVDGPQIDTFNYIFVDCDLKDGIYSSKEEFIEELGNHIIPSAVVDSGNGVHAYWKVSDLNAHSYLRLQRRMIRLLRTDEATNSICQLMRMPGTLNTKNAEHFVKCSVLYDTDISYTCEQLDKYLPAITAKDEQFCQQHYDKTYNVDRSNVIIKDKMPIKFGQLLQKNHEANELWSQITDDRSKNDYRLGHIMFAGGFTRDEARTVLANSAKALQRAPIHRLSYANNIIDKIWTYEIEPEKRISLSKSVKEILEQNQGNTIKGTPLRCHKRIDNTARGFRLGDVIGLIAGSGVGKTSFSLNMYRWFIEQNPDYHHFFVTLEQPANEIADRWNTICQGDTTLNDKVHVLSNYNDDGNFRNLSLSEIQSYLETWQKETGNKIGCVVIDHIGALKKKGAKDEHQDLMTICHSMKAFAIQTNTLLVMQSQTSREKAGIGDLELNKDAAYGTTTFEWYCDYLITIWQPLKRCHKEQSCPTVTAFKFCKIRHKKTRKDVIQEDVPYFLYFDSELEQLRDMTQSEITSFNFFLSKATNLRKVDRKTEIINYQSVPYKENNEPKSDNTGYATKH